MTFIPCVLRELPDHLANVAAMTARTANPINAPCMAGLARLFGGARPHPDHIALLTTKYWGAAGVRLGVAFLDNPPAELRTKILSHMNAWGRTANVAFLEASLGNAEVRIDRAPGRGYWSYQGTDILHIASGMPTMNLDSFTALTPDSEFFRVVRHETGHVLGFPHEHMRAALVRRLNPALIIPAYERSQGWSEAEVRAQVLTSLDERSLLGTPPDVDSIMCYHIDGSLTFDGQPIPGGLDIDASDAAFAARIYPPPQSPPPAPPPSGPPALSITLAGGPAANGTYTLTRSA